jgi:hypothetical protein
MQLKTPLLAAVLGVVLSGGAFAQTTDNAVQRDERQQARVEQGLNSGQLTTKEASQLERGEARIDRMEARDLKDGSLSPKERAQIDRAQDRESAAIHREKHDAVVGDPNSPSARRMEADVQRNVNQERRIDQGIRSGELTNREAGLLERGQARTDRLETRAAVDGHVGHNEQRRIQHAENRQSEHIWAEKHDGKRR